MWVRKNFPNSGRTLNNGQYALSQSVRYSESSLYRHRPTSTCSSCRNVNQISELCNVTYDAPPLGCARLKYTTGLGLLPRQRRHRLRFITQSYVCAVADTVTSTFQWNKWLYGSLVNQPVFRRDAHAYTRCGRG